MKKSLSEQIPVGKITTVKIGAIMPHIRYEKFSTILAKTNYSLTSGSSMTPKAFSAFLTAHPIVVTESKDETNTRYTCVSGLRSLNLAKSKLGVDASVSVISLKQPHRDDINFLISADVIFTHLLFNVKKPETLGKIFDSIETGIIKELFIDGAQKKTEFANQTSYAYNTLFPKKPQDKI